MNSRLVTGFGAVKFTGPRMSFSSSQTRARISSSRVIQLHHWAPDPNRPPMPSLNSGNSLGARPLLGQNKTGASADHPDAGLCRGGCFGLPADAERCEEVVTWRALFCQDLVDSVTVKANGRCAHQHPRPDIETSQRTSEQRSGASATLDEKPLAGLGPAGVADTCARQVDHRVSTFEAIGVDRACRRVPSNSDLTRSNRAAHDPDDVVAGTDEVGAQCLADRAARPRDHDLHSRRSIGAPLPDLHLAPPKREHLSDGSNSGETLQALVESTNREFERIVVQRDQGARAPERARCLVPPTLSALPGSTSRCERGNGARWKPASADDDVWARQVVTSRPETASVDSTSSVDSTARVRLAASTPDAIVKSAATNSAFQPNRFRTSSPRVGFVNPDR